VGFCVSWVSVSVGFRCLVGFGGSSVSASRGFSHLGFRVSWDSVSRGFWCLVGCRVSLVSASRHFLCLGGFRVLWVSASLGFWCLVGMATIDSSNGDEDEEAQQEGVPPKEKKQTSLTNYFAFPQKKRPRGRPKKVASVPVELPISQDPEEAPPPPRKKKQRQNVNWNSDKNWPALKEALQTRRAER
jgi:hypothetical protein